MQFLVDSREVYAAFDEMVVKPENNIFENSGLERVEAINKDIILINTKWGLPTPAPNQAAVDYAAFVKTLSPQASPPSTPPIPHRFLLRKNPARNPPGWCNDTWRGGVS